MLTPPLTWRSRRWGIARQTHRDKQKACRWSRPDPLFSTEGALWLSWERIRLQCGRPWFDS